MGLVVYSAAAALISTADAKAHFRVDASDEDTLIDSLIAAATGYAQVFTRRQFVSATYDLKLDGFSFAPGSLGRINSAEILLPVPPAQSVTSITYTDPDGATQTLDSSRYVLDSSQEPARLVPAYGYSWPSVRGNTPAAVIIRFITGYGAASAVPDAIKTAVKMIAAHWFEHREAASESQTYELPLGARRLLEAYRWGSYV